MGILSSSTKLNLLVQKLPSNHLALTNRVYVSPKIFEILVTECSYKRKDNILMQCPFIIVRGHPFEVEEHPDIQDDEICLNRLQRRTCFLRPRERVEVMRFEKSEQMELGALFFEISFLSSPKKCICEIDTDGLAECLMQSHEGQYFEKGDTIVIDFRGIKLLLSVGYVVEKGLRVEKAGVTLGQMHSLTHLTFQMETNTFAKCVGTKVERGFLNILWKKGAPKGLLDLAYNSCFNALRVGETFQPFSIHIGTDLLHYAMKVMAPFGVIKYLVERFPDAFKTKDVDEPLLFHACLCGSPFEVIKLLLDKSPEAMTKKNFSGSSPLHLACLSENSPSDGVLEFLIKSNRSALTEKNEQGWTPLHCSCATRFHVEVVESLVKECPEALEIKDNDGCLPLHLACGFTTSFNTLTSTEMVQLLLDKNPSAAKEKNRFQQTPLHCACWSCPPSQMVQLLIEQYPGAIKIKDYSNLTPLGIIKGILAAPQGLGFLVVDDVVIVDNKYRVDTELPCALCRLQSALNPSISTNDILGYLTALSNIMWRLS